MLGAVASLLRAAFTGDKTWMRTGAIIGLMMLGFGWLYAEIRDDRERAGVQRAVWQMVLDEVRYIRARVDALADRQ